MVEFDVKKIELKWQKEWEKQKVFEIDVAKGKKKYSIVEMYPYPSGSGLHMGHAFNYTLGDILARYKTMQGYQVLHPMGFDSFGLPAENAAIKAKSHPALFTNAAIENFIRQQKALGLSYDWRRMVQSHDPAYYRWNQYLFLQLYKKGLIYRKHSPVNWCPDCETVLANEQVHQGMCWRHTATSIVIKNLEQWFIKTTQYADELLSGVEALDWPERIKIMQRNWIGKSEGSEVQFMIGNKSWPVFTTRIDTLFGVTFLVVSAQHAKLMDLVTPAQNKEVFAFLKTLKGTSEKTDFTLEKEGVFTGSYAQHPITGAQIPIWAGNFVVADYGSGMVMGVPAHDARDFAFAQKYRIPITHVVKPAHGTSSSTQAYLAEGILCDSGSFTGLTSADARKQITAFLQKKKLARFVTNYKLRDWLVSRQRYWGTPIPMVYCADCGIVPISENDLPVLLPEKVTFGEGNPLATNKAFVETKCPDCGKKARRETDTMDTFFDSSWYYLRYCDAQNTKKPFDGKQVDYWLPVDFYTGGAEHACMHLIYARFFTKALRDMKLLSFDEPFLKLFNQGMVHGEDGVVMSKSRGNTVDPLTMTQTYGADALRFFLVSMAGPDKDFVWSSTGLESIAGFISKVYARSTELRFGKSSPLVQHKVHKAILSVTEAIEQMKYNQATIILRETLSVFEGDVAKEDFALYVQLLAPFCPHLAEELWSRLGNKKLIATSPWPVADTSKITPAFDIAEQAVEKTVSDIMNVLRLVKEKTGDEGEQVYVYTLPKELAQYDAGALTKRVGKPVTVCAVNDPKKHDPQGKASKAKPGKPALFVA